MLLHSLWDAPEGEGGARYAIKSDIRINTLLSAN